MDHFVSFYFFLVVVHARCCWLGKVLHGGAGCKGRGLPLEGLWGSSRRWSSVGMVPLGIPGPQEVLAMGQVVFQVPCVNERFLPTITWRGKGRIPVYQGGNWGTKRLSDLAGLTQFRLLTFCLLGVGGVSFWVLTISLLFHDKQVGPVKTPSKRPTLGVCSGTGDLRGL
jgi:hypothetical protein